MHETSGISSKTRISLGDFRRFHYNDPGKWKVETGSIENAPKKTQLRNKKSNFRTRMQFLLQRRFGDNPSDSMFAQEIKKDIGKDLEREPANAEIYITPENKFALIIGTSYIHEQSTEEEIR